MPYVCVSTRSYSFYDKRRKTRKPDKSWETAWTWAHIEIVESMFSVRRTDRVQTVAEFNHGHPWDMGAFLLLVSSGTSIFHSIYREAVEERVKTIDLERLFLKPNLVLSLRGRSSAVLLCQCLGSLVYKTEK